MNAGTKRGNDVNQSTKVSRRQLLQRAAGTGLAISSLTSVPPARAQPAQVEISLATDWTTAERGEILDQAVLEFESQFPQYTVKVEPIGGDYMDKLAVQFAGGTAADVILMSGSLFLNFQEKGAFADITPHLQAMDVDLSLYTSVPNVFQVGDQQYGMPFQLTITTWFANVDMFEAAGVPLPAESWTWDDMLDAATKLTKPDQGQYGVWMQNSAESFWGPLVMSAGGNLKSEDKTKTAFADGNGFDGFKFAVDLVNEYKVSPTPAQSVGMTSPATENVFAAGYTAMTPANSSSVGNFSVVVGDRFRWQPIPQPSYPPTGGLRTTFNDQPHVVNAQAKDIEGAVNLAVFMSGEFVQGLVAQVRGSTPVLRSLQQTEEYLASPPANVAQVLKNLEFAEDLGFTRNHLEWWRAFHAETDRAFIGEMSAEEAFQQAIEAGDRVLSRG